MHHDSENTIALFIDERNVEDAGRFTVDDPLTLVLVRRHGGQSVRISDDAVMYQPAQGADLHLRTPHLLTSAFQFEFLRRKANDVREFMSNDLRFGRRY